MANSSFTGPVRSKNGFKHYAVSSIGVETEIQVVDASGNMYESSETDITADTSQDQANAYQLSTSWSNITVCATDGDAVALMLAVVGLKVTVKNSGATSLAVFPINGATDQINAMADDLSVNIPPGGQITFRAIAAGANGIWETKEVLVLSAPTTQRGEFIVKATDNDGDTVTTLTNAAMGQASAISIPDPGAATANIVLTSQANNNSLVTATATKLNYVDMTAGTGAASKAVVLDSGDDYTWPNDGVLTIGNYATAEESSEHAAGAVGTSSFGAPETYRWIENGVIITQIKFDITGLGCKGGNANDAIGIESAAPDAYFGRNVLSTCGVIFKATLSCLESAAGSNITQNINVGTSSTSTFGWDEGVGAGIIITGGTLVIGKTVQNLVPATTAGDYYYLTEADTAATDGTFSAGMYVFTTYGHPVLS